MQLFVKFEPIFCKKSEPILQNEPIRILYPFRSPLTKIDKFRQKLVDFYLLLLHSSLFTNSLSVFGGSNK